MTVTSGSETTASTSFASVTELESADVTAFDDGDEAFVSATGTTYQLVKSSTATRTGTFVLYTRQSNPAYFTTPATGRWLYLSGSGGGIISVATLADRPDPASLAQGQVVFVRSQQSSYTVEAGNLYVRSPPDLSWAAQAAWAIDAAGSVENTGAPGFPIPPSEFLARVQYLTQNTSISVAAGSSLGSFEWNPIPFQAPAGGITITMTGAVTLGADRLVASSSDETATAEPLIDASAALVVGGTIQSTSGASIGATAVVVGLVAGTQYRTSAWRNAAGARVAPPLAGTNIATRTLPSVDYLSISVAGGTVVTKVVNLKIVAIDDPFVQFLYLQTCELPKLFFSLGFYTIDGCSVTNGGTIEAPSAFVTLSGFIGGAAFTELQFANGCQGVLDNCAFNGRGVVVRDGAFLTVQRLGVIGSGGTGLQVQRGASCRINGTLYGTGNLVGTGVDTGGILVCKSSVTPTLAGTTEISFDGNANALPPLLASAGLVLPAAAPITTWAQFKAAPFNGNVVGSFSGATICTG